MSARNPRICTTYQIVTEESAEHGDFEETGWHDEEGVEFPRGDPDEPCVEEAAKWLARKGIEEASSSSFHPGIWYCGTADPDYRTGEWTSHCYHLKDFTPQEEEQVYRLLHENQRRGSWGGKVKENPSGAWQKDGTRYQKQDVEGYEFSSGHGYVCAWLDGGDEFRASPKTYAYERAAKFLGYHPAGRWYWTIRRGAQDLGFAIVTGSDIPQKTIAAGGAKTRDEAIRQGLAAYRELGVPRSNPASSGFTGEVEVYAKKGFGPPGDDNYKVGVIRLPDPDTGARTPDEAIAHLSKEFYVDVFKRWHNGAEVHLTPKKQSKKQSGLRQRSNPEKEQPCIRVGFATVTSESAAQGDYAQSGLLREVCFTRNKNLVREVVDFLEKEGGNEFSSSDYDPHGWYMTGWYLPSQYADDERQESFALEGFTDAEKRKIYQCLIDGTLLLRNPAKALSAKAVKALEKYGESVCEQCYEINRVWGEGPSSIVSMYRVGRNMTVNQVDAAINAYAELVQSGQRADFPRRNPAEPSKWVKFSDKYVKVRGSRNIAVVYRERGKWEAYVRRLFHSDNDPMAPLGVFPSKAAAMAAADRQV